MNGFRHAGIHQVFNLLTDINDSDLFNYFESSSEDSASDIEENEVDSVHQLLVVSDVYSDSEPDCAIPLSSSDNNQLLAAISAEVVTILQIYNNYANYTVYC